jgi:hypothetical protein
MSQGRLDIKLKLGRKPACELVHRLYPKAFMQRPDADGSVIWIGSDKDLVAQYDSPTHILYYKNPVKGTVAASSATKRVRVVVTETTTAAVKGDMAYRWYKITSKRLQPMTLRGKECKLTEGQVIGLRPSTDGKTTRMVLKGELTKVMSPTREQVEYILKKASPLIGGPIDKQRIGAPDIPKVGTKERRIGEELELISSILEHGGPNSITDLKIKNKRIYFKYNGRPYGVVSDPS